MELVSPYLRAAVLGCLAAGAGLVQAPRASVPASRAARAAASVSANPDVARWEALARRAAYEEGISPVLLISIIELESRGNPRAYNRAGGHEHIGLGQLDPDTAASVGVSDPWDPDQNIVGTARYLKLLLRAFKGDVARAAAAYNFGPGNVMRGRPWPEETAAYVDAVLRALAAQPELLSAR